MNGLLAFPLLPALIFFLGALTLLVWEQIQSYIPAFTPERKSLAGLAAATLVFLALGLRIALRMTDSFSGPPMVIAPWGTGDGVTVRMDGMSTAFLFVPVLLLSAGFGGRQIRTKGSLLLLASASAAVFVAANGIGFSYALLLFDVFGAVFWLRQNHRSLAMARMLLSVFTTGTLMLAALPANAALGSDLFSFGLWLRLAVFPFAEITVWGLNRSSTAENMVWTALSTATGVYMAARFLRVPPPVTVQILVGVIAVFNASLVWLGKHESTAIKLLRMSTIQPGLILLFAPVTVSVAIALGLGYTLALGALWFSPKIGKPNFLERHWLWVYAPPLLATLTIAGFPFTFGWMAHLKLYTQLLQSKRTGILALVVLAEGLAFSALYHYWRDVFSGNDKREAALMTALVVTIPFLLPGVAGITFNVITGIPFEGLSSPLVSTVLINLALVWGIAALGGYGQPWIIRQIGIAPGTIDTILQLDWLWDMLRPLWTVAARGTLRLKAIFEGTHYLGWAFLLTLVGILVVILQ